MIQDKKRRLAAIMFADIAGYTAMMQRNETEGLASVHRFSEVIEAQAKLHQGEILEFRGDGCLVVFDSAVEAVHAAKAIQQELQQEPVVPLRIGIHLGDIVFTKGNIYGDGVNLASRVESMGVPGSVLVTERVIHDVKSHPEFEMKSLGQFQFKNVEKPMEVFAVANEGLAVPRLEEMQGKGKRVQASKTGMRSLVRFASIGFIAMALGAVLFWGLGSNSLDGQLSDKIKEERVAIIPFSNRTNNSDLEIFGAFCSDLITNGLTETGIKTCSPRTVQQYNHLIGVLPNNPEGKPSFLEVVGARYWVEGNFSLIGDTISVKSYLTDGTDGDIVRNFPEIKGHIGDKEALVGELTKRLMGYWVARDIIDKGKFKPPKYEAFQEYQKIFTSGIYFNYAHGLKAFELDTTFYLAGIEGFIEYADRRGSAYDSVLNLLAPHYNRMTPYEKLRLDACIALYERDYPNYVKYNEALYQMFPRDFVQMSYYGFHLWWRENKPLKAWEVMNTIDWTNLPEKYHEFRKTQKLSIALIGMGAKKYEEILDLLDTYYPQEGPSYMLKSLIYTRTQQLDSLYILADRLERSDKLQWTFPFIQSQEYNLVNFCNDVGEEFLLQEKPEVAKKFLHKAIEWTTEKPERVNNILDSLELARTWRLLGEPEKSLPLEEGYMLKYEKGNRFGWIAGHLYLSGIGIDYAMLGQEEKAR
ncbi:MAG: adenylate/guanylate cyclase domain-containing protein, partial [Bacteroidota bacterium]